MWGKGDEREKSHLSALLSMSVIPFKTEHFFSLLLRVLEDFRKTKVLAVKNLSTLRWKSGFEICAAKKIIF